MSDVASTDTSSSELEIHGYVLGQHNVRPFGLDLHNPVFFVSALVIVGFVLVVLAFQADAAKALGHSGHG